MDNELFQARQQAHHSGEDFIEFALQVGVLQLGEFITKAGRRSPYFFNAGLFRSGAVLAKLCAFYVAAIERAQLSFDMIFGPAYKGIPLASGLAITYAYQSKRDIPYAFNRKEAKDHGEGGQLIGAPLAGRVLIIDDVVSAGTSLRESLAFIRGQQAEPAALVVALDRMERGLGKYSAIQEIKHTEQLSVISIATLDDLVAYLGKQQNIPNLDQHLSAISAYRAQYGAALD